MKTIAHVISAAILASTPTAYGQTQYAGATYEVEMIGNYGRITSVVCMTLQQGGRFTMSDEALTMMWAPRDHYPNQFMAVTAPGDRTVVPYHVGVYGTLQPDKTLAGRGIDHSGKTFVFRGQMSDDCAGDFSERAASPPIRAITNPTRLRKEPNPIVDPCSQMPCDPIPDPLRAAVSHGQELRSTDDPCWSPSGSHVPCDPIADPLRAAGSHGQELRSTEDPCSSPSGSHVPCDPIVDPRRAAGSHGQELRSTEDPCSSPSGSHVPCDPIADPLRAAGSHGQELRSTEDPCSSPSGSHVPCDPIPNPLSADAETVMTSTLAGRSFRLTLGTSDRRVLEYCWTFGGNREIKTDHSKVLRWSPVSSANDVAGFQSVGGGADGRGMAYHGALVGDELLEVVGIEARDGESVVSYGYGQQVSACK